MTTIQAKGRERARAAAAGGDRVRARIAADAVVSTYINDLSGPRPASVVRAARDLHRPRLVGRETARRRRLAPVCAIAGA